MLKEAKILHDSIKELYLDMIPLLSLLEKKTQEEMTTYGAQQVDTAYACRETNNILDELKKKINRISTIAQTVASVSMTAMQEERIKTLHVTATTKPRMWFKIVTRRDSNPEEHDRLLTALGVPKHIAESEAVRIHPPKFCDYMTELVGKGEDVPVDVAKVTATELGLRLVRRKDI